VKGTTVGAITETNMLTQLKRGQGETNVRLDALIAEQKRTNELLDRLGAMLATQQSAAS
jgi:hypothetical protein